MNFYWRGYKMNNEKTTDKRFKQIKEEGYPGGRSTIGNYLSECNNS